MRTEVMYGQYLDLLATGHLLGDVGIPLAVIRYKTAKYTAERPLLIGAALADASPAIMGACTAFALPLGEAFQLVDDLLGVFGAPDVTGKSRLDDRREGKHTVLIACALDRADHGQAALLRALVGNPHLTERGAATATIRDILTTTGARDAVKQMITTRLQRALAALEHAPVSHSAAAALRTLADTAVRRTA
ncbi:polyprenyl synthetase family protein [Streptomyces sp. NPDC059003]|uniref:polyprenyl synthetase family protein n=1 Tax=Streptomyces sp. NPDC059003 TaxID=3346691 RepID=UPI003686F4D1